MRNLEAGLLLSVGFLIGYNFNRPVLAQSTITVESEKSASDAHEHEVTVQELLTVMADFDIRHETERPYAMPAYGVTVFDIDPPAMFIFNSQPFHSKMSTILHEVTHIRCHKLGVTCDEAYVNAEETREYQHLFGAIQ